MRTREELYEKFGNINGLSGNRERIHIDEGLGFWISSGPMVEVLADETDDLYLVFRLDPASPFGNELATYGIHFSPGKDFHFNKASLWIYRQGDFVRIEIRVTQTWYMIPEREASAEICYGFQLRLADGEISGLHRASRD